MSPDNVMTMNELTATFQPAVQQTGLKERECRTSIEETLISAMEWVRISVTPLSYNSWTVKQEQKLTERLYLTPGQVGRPDVGGTR